MDVHSGLLGQLRRRIEVAAMALDGANRWHRRSIGAAPVADRPATLTQSEPTISARIAVALLCWRSGL
ncbi:MAG TPA: hypothetical protein VLN61_05450 [Pseudolabrys sp.]|nr:hypothetical protein [Pseudolabrys sp.]